MLKKAYPIHRTIIESFIYNNLIPTQFLFCFLLEFKNLLHICFVLTLKIQPNLYANTLNNKFKWKAYTFRGF